MFFRSKMIHDPSIRWPNRAGLTVGWTFYTPKYIKCSETNFYSNQFDRMRLDNGRLDLREEDMEMRFLYKRAHRNCRKNKRHRSYTGYMYWTGPKRRYTFNYMGPTRYLGSWWKPLSISKSRYTQWRVGDQPKIERRRGRPEMEERTSRAMDRISLEMRTAMKMADQQMLEYERIRGGIHADSRKRWFASNRPDRLR